MAEERYYYGTGRRKCAIANVRLYQEAGPLVVNDKPVTEYFPRLVWQKQVMEALQQTGMAGKCRVEAKIIGGGLSGQAGALAHGIARALAASGEDLRVKLRHAGLLTRDSRIKEPKKYGLLGARKAKQSPKR